MTITIGSLSVASERASSVAAEAPDPPCAIAGKTRLQSAPARLAAAARYMTSSPLSSSDMSALTHANWRRSRRSHSASSVVFPYPAGAVTSSARLCAVHSLWSSARLITVARGGRGASSFASLRRNDCIGSGAVRYAAALIVYLRDYVRNRIPGFVRRT